jgi:dTDP-4-amino-4,6-dideoxygalactose transaminase
MSTDVDKLALFGGTPVLTSAPPYRWPIITDDDIESLIPMLKRGELSYQAREGKLLELEEMFKAYFGVRHAVATSSGTGALHCAYFGIGLRPGDEVLAPAYTYLATVMPLFATNAVPVLVDADPLTGNLDPSDIERHLTPRTVALVVTHNFGVPADMRRIMHIARKHRLKVIEDCSHAHGATCDGQKVGTFGDVAIFSLQSRKLVPAGEGGVLVTNDDEINERVCLLGQPAGRCLTAVTSEQYRAYASTGFGLKYRIHPLAAALACRQFERLDAYIDARAYNFEYLTERLQGVPGISPPARPSYVTRPTYYSYRPVYSVEAWDGVPLEVVVEAMRAEGVPLERPESMPLNHEAIFQVADPGIQTYTSEGRRLYRPGDFPKAERFVRSTMRVLSYTEPVRPALDGFVQAFQKVFRHRRALLEYAERRASAPLRTATTA